MRAGIIDFHTHAFADQIYERAMDALVEKSGIGPFHNGSLGGLLASMDRAGVERAVVLSIATKPTQVDVILEWSLKIASERIIPFASLMPNDPEALNDLNRIKEAGIKGIKLHPYYQNFAINDPSLEPFFAKIKELDLILVTHAGYDIAWPERQALVRPRQTAELLARHPGLKLVAAHFGGWEDWEEVDRHLLGKDLWLETSFLSELVDRETARKFFLGHDPERLVFGSDTPWVDQAAELNRLESLDLPADLLDALLSGNAQALLGL